jgi:hypothetical protein
VGQGVQECQPALLTQILTGKALRSFRFALATIRALAIFLPRGQAARCLSFFSTARVVMETLSLLCCALVVAQSVPPPAANQRVGYSRPVSPDVGWSLAPRLENAQELVYRGSFNEQTLDIRVQYARRYRLESRVFVLDSAGKKLDLAILTVLQEQRSDPKPAGSSITPGRSVRLERVQVDTQGRLVPTRGSSLAVPLEGPPTIECGAFVPVPRGRVRPNQEWTVTEPGHPEWRWQVAGVEPVNGTLCVKLVGVQQSEDWDHPRADRTAWQRTDTVWVSSRSGVGHRVERIIERRSPARTEPTHRSVLRYDLEYSPRYPARLVEDRRRDIEQACRFQAAARPYLGQPGRHGRELESLLAQIDAHLERQPTPTPYRDAVVQIRARVEAAHRGETPPVLPSDLTDPLTTPTPSTRLAVGRPAPDFLAPNIGVPGRSASLRDWKGRPLLMVFYNPTSRNLNPLMSLVQQVAARHPGVAVIGFAMTSDPDQAARQRRQRGWKFPVIHGTGLRISYAVDCTPRLVLVGADGTVRGIVVGWGSETARELESEIPDWLKQ